jgi:hypothetical protein
MSFQNNSMLMPRRSEYLTRPSVARSDYSPRASVARASVASTIAPPPSTTPDSEKITNIMKNKLYFILDIRKKTNSISSQDLIEVINIRNFPRYSDKNKAIYDKILSDVNKGKNKPFAVDYVATKKIPLSMKLKLKGYEYRKNLENLLRIDSGNFENLPFKKNSEKKARIKASNVF